MVVSEEAEAVVTRFAKARSRRRWEVFERVLLEELVAGRVRVRGGRLELVESAFDPAVLAALRGLAPATSDSRPR